MAGTQHSDSLKRIPPFPTKQMTILGMVPVRENGILKRILKRKQIDHSLTSGSTMSNLRTDSFHVHIPLYLLHDPGFPRH